MIGMIAPRITPPRADFGYVIARTHWNQGYATESALALDQKGIHRLWAVCDIDNSASVRVLEKVGLSRGGVLRRWMYHAGSDLPRDCYSYAKIKGDTPI